MWSIVWLGASKLTSSSLVSSYMCNTVFINIHEKLSFPLTLPESKLWTIQSPRSKALTSFHLYINQMIRLFFQLWELWDLMSRCWSQGFFGTDHLEFPLWRLTGPPWHLTASFCHSSQIHSEFQAVHVVFQEGSRVKHSNIRSLSPD